MGEILSLQTQSSASVTATSGYTCSCGVWVPWGGSHSCWNWQPTQIVPQTQYYWNWTPSPTVSKFKGTVKALDELPTNATVGDAYFVEKAKILVVRVWNGWHHFDGD